MPLIYEIGILIIRLINFASTIVVMWLSMIGTLAWYAIHSPDQVAMSDVGPLLSEAMALPFTPFIIIVVMFYGFRFIALNQAPFRLPERWASAIDDRLEKAISHTEARLKAVFKKS